VGKQEGKRPLGRLSLRWQDIIKIDIKEMGWGSMDWIDLSQDWDQFKVPVNMEITLEITYKFFQILE
jgi:hypothetical protein